MTPKNFYTFSGTIFLIVAIVHLMRVFKGWDVTIGNMDIPMWASWLAIVIGGTLAFNGLKRR